MPMLILLKLLIIIPLMLTSCTKEEVSKPMPVELGREHACAVCGMIIVDFPGAKGQIHYRNGRVDFFCSTIDMLLFYLQPDRPSNISVVFVNDMGKADWKHPVNYWIDAKEAVYVHGADVMGPMGEALVPFSDRKDAEEYIKRHGGRIVGFSAITMEMLRPGM